jgi:hypothetical protein
VAIRWIGNLSVPFRLSSRYRGWSNPKWVPAPAAVVTKSAAAAFSAVSGADVIIKVYEDFRISGAKGRDKAQRSIGWTSTGVSSMSR